MKNKDCNRGFTLVELLITVAILGIIVAPFLATFVTASTNNLKSSDRQRLADAAEDIAEEFKAKSIELLDEEYTPTEDASGGYSFNIPASRISKIGSVNKGYKAEVKLTPSTNAINEDIPTLTNMKTDYTMLFMQAFYNNDVYKRAAGATSRRSIITIDLVNESGVDKYKITLSLQYNNSSDKIEVSSKTFDYDPDELPPSIYAVYVPMSSTGADTVLLQNNITMAEWPDLLDKDGDPVEDSAGNVIKAPMQIYFVVQSGATLNTNNFVVVDNKVGTTSLNYYHTYNDTVFDIHTNALSGSSVLDSTKADNIYDLEVNITNGKSGSSKKVLATYKSSKIEFD